MNCKNENRTSGTFCYLTDFFRDRRGEVQLWLLLIADALPVNKSVQLVEKSHRVLNGRVDIEVCTVSAPSSRVPTIHDLFVLRVILNEISENINAKPDTKKPKTTLRPNCFYIDVKYLAQTITKKTQITASDYKFVNDAIRRISEMGLTIIVKAGNLQDGEEIMSLLGLSSPYMKFYLFQDLKPAGDNEIFQSTEKPEFSAVEFSSPDMMDVALDPFRNGEHYRIGYWKILLDHEIYENIKRTFFDGNEASDKIH